MSTSIQFLFTYQFSLTCLLVHSQYNSNAYWVVTQKGLSWAMKLRHKTTDVEKFKSQERKQRSRLYKARLKQQRGGGWEEKKT